jgi:hypothetical protein
LAEERARQFNEKLSAVDTRLTKLGYIIAGVIGVLSLLLMTPDAIGYRLAKTALGWLRSMLRG